MRSKLYQLFDGRWLDLSHIVEVSPAYFIDRMGHGGWFMGFQIRFMFIDNPARYEYALAHFGLSKEDEGESWAHHVGKYERRWSGEGVPKLQAEVDKLIAAWRELKDVSRSRLAPPTAAK
jgi:hypothetical protein